jgi:hypothetical protein
MTIHVHIERLVLDGLPVVRAQRGTLASALVAEMGRLLAAEGIGSILTADSALAHLRAADLRLGASGGPAALGTQIAAAIHAGMRRPAGRPARRPPASRAEP